MSKYIIEFSKTGTICFTSHLDLMRIFKRVFKRTRTPLAYSQGYNPHPKLGIAQPLSLGYWGMEEYLEFETPDLQDPRQLLQRLAAGMPEGIELKACLNADRLSKTLASHTVAARYVIAIPVRRDGECAGPEWTVRDSRGPDCQAADEPADPQPGDSASEPDPEVDFKDPRSLYSSFMGQEEIPVWKRQKKKKEPKLVDIRPMIREIVFQWVPESEGQADMSEPGTLYIDTLLDGGSASNLSPELVITSVCRRFGIGTDRSEVSVMRKEIRFDQPLQKLIGNETGGGA